MAICGTLRVSESSSPVAPSCLEAVSLLLRSDEMSEIASGRVAELKEKVADVKIRSEPALVYWKRDNGVHCQLFFSRPIAPGLHNSSLRIGGLRKQKKMA